MNPELAKAALVFLSRVDLKGGEAPAFMQVAAALEAIGNQPAEPLPPIKPTPAKSGRK